MNTVGEVSLGGSGGRRSRRDSSLTVLAEARLSKDDTIAPLAGFIASTFSPRAAQVAARCLSQAQVRPDTAVIIVSPSGDVATAQAAASGERISPLLFFQAVPNAVAGYIAAKWDLRGPVVCLEEPGVQAGLDVARVVIRDGDATGALVIFIEDDSAHAVLVRGAQS